MMIMAVVRGWMMMLGNSLFNWVLNGGKIEGFQRKSFRVEEREIDWRRVLQVEVFLEMGCSRIPTGEDEKLKLEVAEPEIGCWALGVYTLYKFIWIFFIYPP